jgi:hypothetical protein
VSENLIEFPTRCSARAKEKWVNGLSHPQLTRVDFEPGSNAASAGSANRVSAGGGNKSVDTVEILCPQIRGIFKNKVARNLRQSSRTFKAWFRWRPCESVISDPIKTVAWPSAGL